MSLYIKEKLRNYEWHVGEPVPDFDGRVITFQADGHELEMILAAMQETQAQIAMEAAGKRDFRARQVARDIHDSLASTHELDMAEDGPEVAILSVDRETPPKFTLVGAVKDLIAAARCFSFNISPLLADDNGVGRITGTPIAAGEMRRLNAALAKFDE